MAQDNLPCTLCTPESQTLSQTPYCLGTYIPVLSNCSAFKIYDLSPSTGALKMPKSLQFRPSVGEAEEVIMIVEVVRRQLLSLLHVGHRSAAEREVVPGKADRVRRARVVQDRGDREETLKVDVLRRVLPDDVRVRVDHAHHVEDLLLGELSQLAVAADEVDHANLGLGQLLVVVQVVHQHVDQLPSVWLVVSQPEHPQHHDGVVGGAGGLVVLDDEPGVVHLEQAALSGVGSVILLAVWTTQGPGAVPTPVDQPWRKKHSLEEIVFEDKPRKSLVASQANRFWVVIGTNSSRSVVKDYLAEQ